MPWMTPPVARRVAALALLAALPVILAGCDSRNRELQPGAYRAVLETPGGDLPFGLDVALEESGFVLYLVNGEERIRVDAVTVADGALNATLPAGGSTLSARITRKGLDGEVLLPGAGTERQVLTFEARLGETWRFFEEPLTDNADLSGRWSMTFTDDVDRAEAAVAEFAQSFSTVTGTIYAPSGNHPNLAGEVRGNDLYLSRFDGTSAWLYRAQVNEHGELAGEFWSGRNSHRRLVAVRDPDAVLEPGGVAPQSLPPGA